MHIKNVIQSRFYTDIYSDEILLLEIRKTKQYLKDFLGLEIWLEHGVFLTGLNDNFPSTDKNVMKYLQYWQELVHIIDSVKLTEFVSKSGHVIYNIVNG